MAEGCEEVTRQGSPVRRWGTHVMVVAVLTGSPGLSFRIWEPWDIHADVAGSLCNHFAVHTGQGVG